jgi:hypothetical protein
MKADELLTRVLEATFAYNDGIDAGLPEYELNKLLLAYNDVIEEARVYLSEQTGK